MTKFSTTLAMLLVVALFALGCSSSSDDPAGECTNECPALMEQQCFTGGYRVCGNYDDDSCYEWGQLQTCPDGQACDETTGQCVTSSVCQDECVAGARECTSESSFHECGQFDEDECLEWGAAIACKPGSTCVGDSICPAECANECEMDERECTDATHYRICAGDIDADGCFEWGGETACGAEETCSAGTCQAACDDECENSGQQACDGTTGTHVCGDFDDDDCLEWSTTTNCPDGTFCQQGVCAPPACEDTCDTAGERECVLSGFRECGNWDDDACLEWGEPTDCPDGQSCSGAGVCSTVCEDDCDTLDERSCQGELGYRICGNYDADDCLDWSSVFPCGDGDVCEDGACVLGCEDECDAGDRECTGVAAYHVCGNFDDDACREWGEASNCDSWYECEQASGNCVLTCQHECEIDERECAGDTSYHVCGDADDDPCREWLPAEDCTGTQVCNDETAQCSPPDCTNECEAGGVRCSEDGLGTQTCGQNDLDPCLEWSPTTNCPTGYTCLGAGNCVLSCSDVCDEEGVRICAGSSSYFVCGDSNGDSCLDWGAAQDCADGETCDGGLCVIPCSDECSPADALGCNEAGDAVVTCGDYDADTCLEWGNAVDCGDDETCSGGVCSTVCEDECALDDLSCSGDGAYLTCGQFDTDDCLEWSQPTLCAAGESCVEGACITTCEDECSAGQARCVSDEAYQECGNWDEDVCLEYGSPTACADDTFCHEGSCIADEPPRVVLINEILYNGDSTDDDDVFLELFGDPGAALDHFVVREINGSDGATTGEIDLMGQTLPADGYFVVTHETANATLALVSDLSDNAVDFQNGEESVLLLWGGRVVVDAVGYGFTDDTAGFQGEGLSAPAAPIGGSLSRDEFSIDSDVNRWDFHPVETPTPGAAHASDWAKDFVTTPPEDDSQIGIYWPDVAANFAGFLSAVFIQDQAWGVQFAMNALDGTGWSVSTVYDEAAYTSGENQFGEYYFAPPAVDPDGYAGAAWLGSLYNESTDEFLGVQVGYSVLDEETWVHEFPAEVGLTCDDDGCSLDRMIWNSGGVRLAFVDDLYAMIGFIAIDSLGAYISVAVQDDQGTWTEEIAADEEVPFFAMYDLVVTGGVHHLFYTVETGESTGVYELRHRSRDAGVWSAYDVVYGGFTSPQAVDATVDAEGNPHVCFLDILTAVTDDEGGIVSGTVQTACASGSVGAWTIDTALAAGDDVFPVELDVSADANGPVIVIQDLYEKAVWKIAKDGSGAWLAPALVDFGGNTGNWPTVTVDADATTHVLGSALVPLRGILHSSK